MVVVNSGMILVVCGREWRGSWPPVFVTVDWWVEGGGDRCRKLGLACYRRVLRLPEGDIAGRLSCSRMYRRVFWYRFTFLNEDGGSSFFRIENLKALVSLASPGGTKSDVLRNVPLDVTAEHLYGNHGKARLVTPSFGFVVVLKRSERILSVLSNNMQQMLSSQADSRPAAQAIPHLLRNPNGQFNVFGSIIWNFEAQWSLYVPPGLTFTNSTFCPHSVFVCFVWISEQTAIISLYSIN